jgi:hypothetical protein
MSKINAFAVFATATLLSFAPAAAFAQATQPATTPAAKSSSPAPTAPAPASSDSSSKPRSAVSMECSKQADAKGLHGKERKQFRSECRKNAAAKPG